MKKKKEKTGKKQLLISQSINKILQRKFSRALSVNCQLLYEAGTFSIMESAYAKTPCFRIYLHCIVHMRNVFSVNAEGLWQT